MWPPTLDARLQNPTFLEGQGGPALPAKLQVGEDRAAVYTTKIMLALNRVSELQWQPFMVRVRINIAGSKALGAGGGRQGGVCQPQ